MDLNWFQKIDFLSDFEMAKTDFEALRHTINLFESQDLLPEDARKEITEDAPIAIHRVERVVCKYCVKHTFWSEQLVFEKLDALFQKHLIHFKLDILVTKFFI